MQGSRARARLRAPPHSYLRQLFRHKAAREGSHSRLNRPHHALRACHRHCHIGRCGGERGPASLRGPCPCRGPHGAAHQGATTVGAPSHWTAPGRRQPPDVAAPGAHPSTGNGQGGWRTRGRTKDSRRGRRWGRRGVKGRPPGSDDDRRPLGNTGDVVFAHGCNLAPGRTHMGTHTRTNTNIGRERWRP